MIRYLEKQNLLILETERTSYWIGLAYPAPVCLHWGRKIAPEDADKTIETLKANGVEAYKLGELTESDEGVILG